MRMSGMSGTRGGYGKHHHRRGGGGPRQRAFNLQQDTDTDDEDVLLLIESDKCRVSSQKAGTLNLN